VEGRTGPRVGHVLSGLQTVTTSVSTLSPLFPNISARFPDGHRLHSGPGPRSSGKYRLRRLFVWHFKLTHVRYIEQNTDQSATHRIDTRHHSTLRLTIPLTHHSLPQGKANTIHPSTHSSTQLTIIALHCGKFDPSSLSTGNLHGITFHCAVSAFGSV